MTLMSVEVIQTKSSWMTSMLSGFDVSCLIGTSDATLRSRELRIFGLLSGKQEKRYRAVEDLASLVLCFALLLNMRHRVSY